MMGKVKKKMSSNYVGLQEIIEKFFEYKDVKYNNNKDIIMNDKLFRIIL